MSDHFQVANLKKESVFQWYKDNVEVIPEVPADLNSGVCKFPLTHVSTSLHKQLKNCLAQRFLSGYQAVVRHSSKIAYCSKVNQKAI